MNLAIFDFDNTITCKDSLIDFIYHTVGPLRFWGGFLCLSPLLTLYQLGLVNSGKTKEMVLNHFFKNYTKEKFTTIASLYSQNHLPAIIRESALQRIHWHQNQGHQIVIVSASPENYLTGWCQHIDARLLATQLEFKEGKFSGKLKGLNCKAQEKIRRLEEHYDLKKFEYIYAYGDNKSDLVQKSIANEFHYRSFQ
jgi:HAD superfamily hydrolase (TIGR01490 family)